MNLGIVPGQDQSYGGQFHYGATVVRAIARTPLAQGAHHISVIGFPDVLDAVMGQSPPAWGRVSLYPPFHPRRALRWLHRTAAEELARRATRRIRLWQAERAGEDRAATRPEIGRWYRRHGMELIFWSDANALAFECGVPFVMAVHDLQHRVQPGFQATAPVWELEAREFYYQKATRAATLLVADSEIGREDILEAYGDHVQPDQVKVLPFVPPPNLSTADPEGQIAAARQQWRLPPRYFFYPAQFWPQKNHVTIIRALALLRARGVRDAAVVFAGSREGQLRARTFREMMTLASTLDVVDRVTVLGFVPDAFMGGLYLGARGLVMPTLLGPTNIPVLEAWLLGCPVVTSDLRGMREQAGDAALLVNPESAEALADAMLRLWTDDSLHAGLAEAGRRRVASWTEQDFGHRLAAILEEGYARA